MASESFKSLFKKVKKDIRVSASSAVRQAAVEIMNDLAKAGPAYSGEFSSAWYAVPPGTEPGAPRSSGGSIYKYDLRNVPEKNFQTSMYYEIVNGASYAPQALDLEEGRFRTQYDSSGNIEVPIKKPVDVGTRTGKRRGEVSTGAGFAVSTAPLDWYSTYSQGGGLVKAVQNGVEIGFRQGPFGGKNFSSRGFG